MSPGNRTSNSDPTFDGGKLLLFSAISCFTFSLTIIIVGFAFMDTISLETVKFCVSISITFLVVGGILVCQLLKKRNRVLNTANSSRAQNTIRTRFDLVYQFNTPVHISLHQSGQVSLVDEH